jgi:hypothetical protein
MRIKSQLKMWGIGMLRPTSNEGKKYERRTPLVKKKKKSRSEALCPPTKKKKKEKKGRTTLPLKEEREIRFFIEKKKSWSTKIQPFKLKSDFGKVIYEARSTFLPIGLRYYHKLLVFEILD